jgi:hypothetical protein
VKICKNELLKKGMGLLLLPRFYKSGDSMEYLFVF